MNQKISKRLDKGKLEVFWKEFKQYIRKNNINLKLIKPQGYACRCSSPGISNIRIVFRLKYDRIISNVYVIRAKDVWFKPLIAKEQEINKLLGDATMEWHKKKVTYHIDVSCEIYHVVNESNYAPYFKWLVAKANILVKEFAKEYPELKKYQA